MNKLLCFTADWCKPCQNMKPTIKSLVEKYGDRVQVFNVDTNLQERAQYGVGAVPTFVLVNASGTILDTKIGSATKGALEHLLGTH